MLHGSICYLMRLRCFVLITNLCNIGCHTDEKCLRQLGGVEGMLRIVGLHQVMRELKQVYATISQAPSRGMRQGSRNLTHLVRH